jgi:protein phosphatase PTC7
MKIYGFLFLAQSSKLAFGFVSNANRQCNSCSSSSSSSSLFGAPEILAEEGTWQAFLDEETTGLIYYFDSATGESLWEPPNDTFPDVILPRKKQRLADDLRREYRQSIDGETNDSNWLSGLFEARQQTPVEEEEEQAFVDETDETGGSPWSFGGIASGFQQETAVEEEQAEQPVSTPWFGGIASGFQQETTVEEEQAEQPVSTPWFGGVGGIGSQKEAAGKEIEEPAAASKPKKDWFGSIFGESTATEKEEKPVAEKKKNPSTKPRGILESQGASKPADKVIVAKQTVVVQPGKKKDPKIGGGVKVTPIASPARKKTDVEIRTEPIKLEIASNILPHPAKIMWGGEDAVFTKGRTFGVFDGVSGAEKLDGVPLYSRTLAIEMKKRVGNEGLNVQEMTKFLTESADVADAYATGASTAVVASIGENGFLQALNVGDSCCMVIRDGKVAAKTREISHYWECPYQLSSDSPDRPKDGTKLNVELTPGDLIIMGSDGVFDNVSDDLILDTVASTSMKAGQIAKKLSSVSRKQSLDKNAVTPYSKQAQKRGLPEFQDGIGGKVDDVGCVVIVCK